MCLNIPYQKCLKCHPKKRKKKVQYLLLLDLYMNWQSSSCNVLNLIDFVNWSSLALSTKGLSCVSLRSWLIFCGGFSKVTLLQVSQLRCHYERWRAMWARTFILEVSGCTFLPGYVKLPCFISIVLSPVGYEERISATTYVLFARRIGFTWVTWGCCFLFFLSQYGKIMPHLWPFCSHPEPCFLPGGWVWVWTPSARALG